MAYTQLEIEQNHAKFAEETKDLAKGFIYDSRIGKEGVWTPQIIKMPPLMTSDTFYRLPLKPKLIDVKRPVRLISDHDTVGVVRLQHVPGDFPLLVVFELSEEERYPIYGLYDLEGKFTDSIKQVLENIPEEPEVETRWINIYPGKNPVFQSWATRENADTAAGETRINCIGIPIQEGEGL